MRLKFFAFTWKILFIAAFSAFFIARINPLHDQVKKWYNLANARGLHQAMRWLKENSKSSDVVLTKWQYGAQVVAHAQRPTVATCKVYPSEAEEVAQRYNDISRNFFRARREKRAMEIVKKYDVKYVLLRKKRTKGKRLIDRMRAKKSFNNFQLMYDSDKYMIYKVMKEPLSRE